MDTQELRELAQEAEDNGEEVNVYLVEGTDVIAYVEVNDDTFENEWIRDELEELADSTKNIYGF